MGWYIHIAVFFSQSGTGSLFVRAMHYRVPLVQEDASFAGENICGAECQGWHTPESSICLAKTSGSGSVRSQKDEISSI